MSAELLNHANALHKKLQQLAVEVKSLRKERDMLKHDLEQSQRKLDQLYASNRTLQAQLDSGTLSHALIPREDTTALRLRLNKIIKELDGVISYLEVEDK